MIRMVEKGISEKASKLASSLGRENFNWWENFLKEEQKRQGYEVSMGPRSTFYLNWDSDDPNMFLLKYAGIESIVKYSVIEGNPHVFLDVIAPCFDGVDAVRGAVVEKRDESNVNVKRSLRLLYGSPKFDIGSAVLGNLGYKGAMVRSRVNKPGVSGKRDELFSYGKDFFVFPCMAARRK